LGENTVFTVAARGGLFNVPRLQRLVNVSLSVGHWLATGPRLIAYGHWPAAVQVGTTT
jgi:hypothetical protein